MKAKDDARFRQTRDDLEAVDEMRQRTLGFVGGDFEEFTRLSAEYPSGMLYLCALQTALVNLMLEERKGGFDTVITYRKEGCNAWLITSVHDTLLATERLPINTMLLLDRGRKYASQELDFISRATEVWLEDVGEDEAAMQQWLLENAGRIITCFEEPDQEPFVAMVKKADFRIATTISGLLQRRSQQAYRKNSLKTPKSIWMTWYHRLKNS